MQASEISSVVASISQTYIDLLGRRAQLTMFTDAKQWIADAQGCIFLTEKVIGEFGPIIGSLEQALAEVRAERRKLPILKRMFSSRKVIRIGKKNIKNLEHVRTELGKARDTLEQQIQGIPTSKKKQAMIIKELRVQKAELTADKKDLTLSMQQVRARARATTAAMTGARGNMARAMRANNQWKKENALRPLEQQKRNLDLAILDLDRQINYATRFSGAEDFIEDEIRICGYCGRRAEAGRECDGCGSTESIPMKVAADI